MPLYLSRIVVMRCLPLGSMRGSFSSSARISASSSSERSTSMMCWPGSVPPWRLALAGLALADDVAFLAVAGADAAGVVAVAEVRQLDAADGDADQVLALLADQLALGEELAQVLPDPALDDLAEALVIFFDLQDHDVYSATATTAASRFSGECSRIAHRAAASRSAEDRCPRSRRSRPSASRADVRRSADRPRRAPMYAPNRATGRCWIVW